MKEIPLKLSCSRKLVVPLLRCNWPFTKKKKDAIDLIHKWTISIFYNLFHCLWIVIIFSLSIIASEVWIIDDVVILNTLAFPFEPCFVLDYYFLQVTFPLEAYFANNSCPNRKTQFGPFSPFTNMAMVSYGSVLDPCMHGWNHQGVELRHK